MSLAGELSLWIALVMAAWTTTISLLGGVQRRADFVESGRRATYVTFAFVLLATVGLWTALLANDFAYTYVVSNISKNVPKVYVLSSLWAGEPGALLFCTLGLSAFASVFVATNGRTQRTMTPWATAILGSITLVMLAAICFSTNVYERLDAIATDGRGMNPTLQSPGMAVYPAVLYVGLMSTAIPLAIVISALFGRCIDARCMEAMRRWALSSWLLLTFGLLIGVRSAYVDTGWNPGWVWNSGGSASVLPWLTITAVLYGMIGRTSRSAWRHWNLTVVAGTFLLAVFAAFSMRTGIVDGTRALGRSPVGLWTVCSLVSAATLMTYLCSHRIPELRSATPVVNARRTRLGGVIAFGGMAVFLCAFIGQCFATSTSTKVRTGERISTIDPFGNAWTFTSLGMSQFEQLNRRILAVSFSATQAQHRLGVIASEQREFINERGESELEPIASAGILTTPTQDVYVMFSGATDNETAAVRIMFNPIVWCAWIGGALMILGGIIAVWPRAQPSLARVTK